MIGASDIEQLEFAIQEGRVLFTYNKRDFILLHKALLSSGKKHNGIIVSDQLPTGVVLRKLMKLWFSVSSEQMISKLDFLSNWKQST